MEVTTVSHVKEMLERLRNKVDSGERLNETELEWVSDFFVMLHGMNSDMFMLQRGIVTTAENHLKQVAKLVNTYKE